MESIVCGSVSENKPFSKRTRESSITGGWPFVEKVPEGRLRSFQSSGRPVNVSKPMKNELRLVKFFENQRMLSPRYTPNSRNRTGVVGPICATTLFQKTS